MYWKKDLPSVHDRRGCFNPFSSRRLIRRHCLLVSYLDRGREKRRECSIPRCRCHLENIKPAGVRGGRLALGGPKEAIPGQAPFAFEVRERNKWKVFSFTVPNSSRVTTSLSSQGTAFDGGETMVANKASPRQGAGTRLWNCVENCYVKTWRRRRRSGKGSRNGKNGMNEFIIFMKRFRHKLVVSAGNCCLAGVAGLSGSVKCCVQMIVHICVFICTMNRLEVCLAQFSGLFKSGASYETGARSQSVRGALRTRGRSRH